MDEPESLALSAWRRAKPNIWTWKDLAPLVLGGLLALLLASVYSNADSVELAILALCGAVGGVVLWMLLQVSWAFVSEPHRRLRARVDTLETTTVEHDHPMPEHDHAVGSLSLMNPDRFSQPAASAPPKREPIDLVIIDGRKWHSMVMAAEDVALMTTIWVTNKHPSSDVALVLDVQADQITFNDSKVSHQMGISVIFGPVGGAEMPIRIGPGKTAQISCQFQVRANCDRDLTPIRPNFVDATLVLKDQIGGLHESDPIRWTPSL